MTPYQIELTNQILTRLSQLEDTTRFPDVQELREVAAEILTEQLREIGESPEPPLRRAKAWYPRAG